MPQYVGVVLWRHSPKKGKAKRHFMLQKLKEEFRLGRTLLEFGILRAIGRTLGMIAPLIIAKFFSKELFASYSLASMILFFFTSLLIASAQRPFIVYANQEKAIAGRINKSFSIQVAFFGGSLALFLLLKFSLDESIQRFARVDESDLLFMTLAFIGIAVKTFLSNLFMALGKVIKNSLVELFYGIVVCLSVIIVGSFGKIDLSAVFLAHFGAGIIVALLFIRSIEFNLLLPLEFNWGHFKEVFHFTRWMMLGSAVGYVINWGDNVVLRFCDVSLGDIGAYNLGYSIFKGIMMLTFIVSAYFMPFVSQHIDNRDKMRAYLYRKRPRIILLGIAGMIFLFVSIPHLLGFLYGDEYASSVGVIRILLFGSVVSLYSAFYGPLLGALERFRFEQATHIMQMVLNLGLNVVLIPQMGILGAALATVLGYICRLAVLEVYFKLKVKTALGI